MPRPTGGTAQERIMLRANAIGKVKEPEENTARSRILSRAAELGEVKPAEAAPKYAEETTREPYSIAALGAGDYSGGGQLLEKIYKTARSAVKGIGASYANIGGSAVEGMGNLQETMQRGEYEKKIQQMKDNKAFFEQALETGVNPRTGEKLTEDEKNRYYKILNTQYTDGKIAQMENIYNDATVNQKARTMEVANDAFSASDRMKASADADIAAAKDGSGSVGNFLVDIGYTGTQILADAAANAIAPGAGMLSMASRVYGDASAEARREGKTAGQQALAGLKSAGIETLTEKMFGAFGKIYGKAGADELVEKLVTKLTSNKTGQALLTWIVNGAGEGVEEVTSDILNPLADRILQLDDGNGPVYSVDDAAQMGYDFLLGSAMGLIGGSAQAGYGLKQGKSQSAENAYYENLQKNGLFNDASAEKAAKASEAMRRAMPHEYTEMYRSAYARPLSYAVDRKRYERDVQRNTAPDINTKAAEAVEAVTRGETITGNQAAAIARDPVAVEVLEQRTGVKLDTDKPISQVKRDIAGLASREVTQEAQRATPPSPAGQKRAEKRVGGFLENGQKAYQEMSRTAEDAPSLYAGFSSVYNAGLNGIEADKAKGKYAAMLTPEQRYAAYNAGLEDARVQLARENAEVASVTTTAGAGLADNEYSRGLIAAKKDTAATLNAWGKKLGVRIEIVGQVLGGRANGQYIKEQNLIQIAADSDKPLLNVTAHEITHRMQDLSPAEYRKFRQAAVEYKMRENGADTEAEIVERYMEAAEQEGVTLTRDEVMDELAADFTGDMLDDAALFAKFSKENRTAAQKLLDSLKEFLNKVRGLFTGKYRDMAAQEAYGKDFAELEAIAKQWQAAFDAAERKAESAKKTATEGGEARYSLKQTSDGQTYVMVENAMTNAQLKDHQAIADYIAEHIGEVYTIIESGQRVYIGKDLPNEYTHSKYTQRIANSAKQRAKNRAVSNLGEMVEIATNRRWEKTRHPNNKDAAYGMYRYDTTFAFPVKGENGVYRAYDAELLIRNASDGRKYLYDIVSIKENTGLALDLNQKARGRQNAATQSGASGTSILTDGENVKPQFSLKAPVEETKNLLALHNLTEKNLLDAAKLGGLPMPSIAIVKADEGHGEYGDISFVFSKDTIDPQLFRSNKVYGYDAWTPTAPQIEYEVNEKSAKKIHDLFSRMERAKGRSFADPLYSAANTLEDELNRKGGVDKVVGAMRDDPRVMNIYLEDTGRGAVDNVIKREVTRMDDNQQEMASFLIRELGDGVVNDFRPKGNESPVAARKLWYKDHGEALNAALQKYYEKLGLPAKDAADVVNAETVAAKTRYMLDARKYLAGNTETVTEEVDRDATDKAIRDKVNQKEYEQWLDDLFDGVVKNEGIYNGKDYYTSSGNRRSFSATHYEITLENIVKAMKQGDQKGANTFFGGQAIWGVASKDYGSIDEIKADSGRLQKMTEEEYSAIRQKYSERLAELTNEIKDPAARNEFIASDDAASAIVETLRTKRTVAAIDKELRTYPTLQIKPDTAEKVLRLAQDISNMPTGYFEAKPQRAVGFDEVLAAVIPNDASAEVKAALKNAGVRMIEYASGDEKARLDAVNSVGNARFSLKATAEVEREARELKKERNALAKQNEALKQRVQELKGEMRISKEPSVVARDVKKLGLNLIREYGSDVKYADVQSEMDALAKAVMKRDVTMEDLMPHAKAVAEAIVDNTSELTEYGAELLEIRDHLKRQTIQFSGDMANYNDFRKSHLGTLKLNKGNGTSVDTVYGELTEMFGEGYFPSDVHTEADKLLQIGDVLDGLDSVYQNPFEGYRDAAVQEIANQLIDGMISDQVRQKKTYADRRALEKQEAVGRVREMLSRERQKRRDDVNALRKKYNEKTKKGSEKRKATAMRARIARHTGAISRKLVNPTDKQHIPERLRVAVASLLQNINLESAYSYDENGRLRKNADGDPTRRTLEADRLKQIYDDILTNEGNMVVDPALTESGGLLDSLSALGGKRIADMSVSELETVWNAIRAIETTLTTYDKTLSSAKYKSTSEWAERFAADSMGRKRRNRKISLDMADPYTFFSAYGDAGKQLYRTLRNAQDQQHWMLRDVQREAEKFLDKNVYKNRFDRHTFTTGRGVELTLTTDQIMNLYNLVRRGEQAMHHLTVGGIVQPEIKRNGKLKEIPRGNNNILLTEEDIKAITSVLTPEQVKVANGLQKLASTKLAEWGNNASMQVYGYRKFKEEHYWPIKAAKDAVASSVEKDADNARSIKNMGSAKALTPNASNALDIGGAYDVFAQNASDMIKYATLLAPMEDINRLYNYRYRDSSGNLTGRNMQQVLSGVYGDAAQKYWRNLMRDMQNGMVKNSSDTTRSIERIVGNTKGAAVGSNWRVVIQQPTAFFRAAVILDPENMAKGIAKGVTDGNGWDKARNWAAIAGIKDSSGFDQGSRYTIAREVYGSSDSVMDKLSDWSSRAAANADAITWGKIWNACEWQVAAATKAEVGSDAYYRQVAELFTDVIDQTQVVDGIMQRTQIMRDSDALTRQATSFMGEPLKSLNILMRSYDAWRFETNTQKRSAALKQLKRSVGALLVTDVINSLAQSIVDALRDDDKEKKYWGRFFAALTGVSGDEENFGEVAKNVLLEGNLKDNITLVGRLPYAKDLISILQGYSVERMDADAIGDIVRATQMMYSSVTGKGKYTTAYACKQLLTATSKIFGISVANLGRDVWAAARSAANEMGSVRIMFEMEKAIYRMDRSAGNRKRWCELLYLAQKENDAKTARMIYKEMLEHGYDEKDVRQGVETIMKKEQGVESVKELKNRWRAP